MHIEAYTVGDAAWLIQIATLAVSITARGDTLRLFVLHDQIPAQQQDQMQCRLERYRVQLLFVTVDGSALRQYPLTARLRHETLFRLQGSEVLPPDLERVLCLDGDMLALRSLGPLMQVPLGRAAVAAVIDCWRGRAWRKRLDRLTGCGLGAYFNAGLLVMDLSQWRAQRWGARALRVFEQYAADFEAADQDALNVVLPAWASLPLSWNAQTYWYAPWAWPALRRDQQAALRRPALVHFCGEHKPWLAQPPDWLPYQKQYWQYRRCVDEE